MSDKSPRKAHSIRFSASEWHLVTQRARRAGLKPAEYVRRRTLEPVHNAVPAVTIPAALLSRLAVDVRALATVEAWRFAADDATDEWDRIVATAAREIEPELP